MLFKENFLTVGSTLLSKEFRSPFVHFFTSSPRSGLLIVLQATGLCDGTAWLSKRDLPTKRILKFLFRVVLKRSNLEIREAPGCLQQKTKSTLYMCMITQNV